MRIPKRASHNVKRSVLATQAQIERDLARLTTEGERLKYLDLVGDIIHSEMIRAGVQQGLDNAGDESAGE